MGRVGAVLYAGAHAPADLDDCAWDPDDALFATLDGAAGRHYGIISVDQPRDGRRPDDGHLEVLSAIAAHAAQTIENAARVRELRAALRRHRAVLDSSLDGVIAIDAHGRVLEFNPAAEEIFGYRSADTLGRELAELIVAPEDRDAHRHGLDRSFKAGHWSILGRRMEMTGMRADGSRLPVELTLTLVEDAGDEGPVVYGFLRDISERRRGEEQLRLSRLSRSAHLTTQPCPGRAAARRRPRPGATHRRRGRPDVRRSR